MRRFWVWSLVGAAALVAAPVALGSGPAGAAGTFVVNSAADSGPGTLRQAFADASGAGGGDINVEAGLGQITLSTGAITFSSSGAIVVNGNGVHVDGGGSASGVIRQTGGAGDLSLDGITITGSNATGPSPGAVVQLGAGALNLSNCSFSGNQATTSASDAAGGALVSPTSGGGSLTITGCTFSDNTATSTSGEIGGAVAHDANGSMSIRTSALTGNSATGSAQSDVAGGAVNNGGPTTIADSSIVGNHGTGINVGGGVVNESGVETTANSTIAANTATAAAGGGNVGASGGILNQGGNEQLIYVTLTGNTGTSGATNDAANYVNQGGTVTFFGSVVAGGSGGPSCLAVPNTSFASNGFNAEDDAAASCGFAPATQDIVGQNPNLGPLGNNGGPGPTRLPQPGSLLIDAIPPASCQSDGASGITTDERSLPRPEVTGGLCDIGAVEVQPNAPGPGPTPAAPVQAVVRFTG
jgi:hypothetical protein